MIYFSDFAAAASSGGTIATLEMLTGTATATVNHTSSALGGLTPAAAFIVGSVHVPTNDPGETSDCSFALGSIVGSSSQHVRLFSRDNRAETYVRRSSSSSTPLSLLSGGISAYSTTAGATIANGVSISYQTINIVNGCRGAGIAFAGTGTSAKHGIIPLGTGTSAISVTGVGFQPDVVIFYGNGDDFAAGESSLYQYTLGFATSDGTQRSVSGAELEAQFDSAPFQAILTDAAAQAKQVSSTIHKMIVGGFNSDGFTITPNVSQGSDDLAYLALKFTGQAVKIVDFTTPTSTGSQAITGAGFTPQAAIVVLTNLEAVNSAAASTSDLQGGFSISLISDTAYSVSTRIDSGAATTDTATQCTTGLMGPSATDCDAIKATLTSFDSDGMTLNYSAVQGTGKKGFILFIE